MPTEAVAAQSTRTLSYAEAIREALGQAMAADPRVFLFGEDVGVYGGAFGVSGDLFHRFGARASSTRRSASWASPAPPWARR